MSDEQKPRWTFWCGAIILVLALYVASFGPACWIVTWIDESTRFHLDVAENKVFNLTYRPIACCVLCGPINTQNAVVSFLNLWISPTVTVEILDNGSGREFCWIDGPFYTSAF